MEAATSSSQSLTFYDFLDRMRNPASLDLVRSIKSFIVSFSFYPPNPENDGKRVQDFFLTMEGAIRDHPLWTGATDEEIDRAMEEIPCCLCLKSVEDDNCAPNLQEPLLSFRSRNSPTKVEQIITGLEKYVMTKLFSRTFASSLEDVKIDHEISEKICLLQTFLRPEHLDIPVSLRNEASWLLAEKELQKINSFKAPREKLSSIMSCCRIINNLLLNSAMSENHVPAGADDFLPVLIYVTIKANPPQLQSNLKFIQLYRRQAKLISEPAYYFTNLVSTKEFIVDLNASSLSIDEITFEESMQAAKSISKVRSESSSASKVSQPDESQHSLSKEMYQKHEDVGVMVHGSNYPYLEAKTGELTVRDVDRLLGLYKDVVTKYTSLCKAISFLSTSEREPLLRHLEGVHPFMDLLSSHPQRTNKSEDHVKPAGPYTSIG